jgi:8-oxo-dGTP pyrophosphatase MutT (NUDIX family)
MKQVANAIILRDSAVLLARHPESGCWILPGGKVEEGESTKKALVRELSEELPEFQISSMTYFHTIVGTTPSSKEKKVFIFYVVEGAGPVTTGAEVEEVIWSTDPNQAGATKVTEKVLFMLERDGAI